METNIAPWRTSSHMSYNGSSTMTPAYTSVTSRRSLAPTGAMNSSSVPMVGAAGPVPYPQAVVAAPPLPPQPPASAPPPKKMDWPQSVRNYVQRCFAPEASIPGISRGEMEVKLKQVITEAAETNRLYVVDWDSHPLPQQLIQQERAASSSQPYWNRNPNLPTNTQMPPESPGHGFSKKRSADEINVSSTGTTTPPWRKNHSGAGGGGGFEDRVTYANKNQADRLEKRQKKAQTDNVGQSKFQENLEKRRQRFGLDKSHSPHPWSRTQDGHFETSHRFTGGPVVGTSQQLEKNYFRLTSAPKPEDVRPLDVLQKTLELLKQKWRQEGNYAYICDQFKSLRQDLTVQHIKNSFTVDVYELHARIALEKGDLGEYNQCQTQLRALYSLKSGGHPAEFLAYRILYFIHTCNRTGLNDVLADLTAADKEQTAVKHALDTRSALALGNYHRFFRLYLDVPNMGAYLMDMFVERERLAALANMCRAYKPKVNIRFLTEELAFESHQETVQFLLDHGAEKALEEETDGNNTNLLLNPSIALSIFESGKKSAFGKVDIKGQI